MGSSDQIPVHGNCCLTLKVVRFSDGYIRLGNENVYINHIFVTCWLYCSASFVYITGWLSYVKFLWHLRSY